MTISAGRVALFWGLAATLIIAVSSLAAVTPATAYRPVPSYVKSDCANDYNRFCKEYVVDTPQLDKCMKSHGKQLSCVCLRSLVRAGRARRSTLRTHNPRC